MAHTGRKVFEEKVPVRVIFRDPQKLRQENGNYIAEGFSLPATMVEEGRFVPGGFVFKEGCSVVPTTVFDERGNECLMIKGGYPVSTEVLIPYQMLEMVSDEDGRRAHPCHWQ